MDSINAIYRVYCLATILAIPRIQMICAVNLCRINDLQHIPNVPMARILPKERKINDLRLYLKVAFVSAYSHCWKNAYPPHGKFAKKNLLGFVALGFLWGKIIFLSWD